MVQVKGVPCIHRDRQVPVYMYVMYRDRALDPAGSPLLCVTYFSLHDFDKLACEDNIDT